ncbi:hypothetical protein L7F22_044229 [Adiantum nelumboides]|nr:hypothetical protein [Adiantum nelumboides]
MWGEKCKTFNRPGSEERLALTDFESDKHTYTRKEARELISKISATLLKVYNIKSGDHVVLAYPTSSLFALIASACIRVGIVMVMVNHLFTPEQIKYAYNISESTFILATESIKENIKKADIEEKKCIFVESELDPNSATNTLLTSLEEAASVLSTLPTTSFDESSPLLISFSSGTTGNPKPVVLTHANYIAFSYCIDQIPGYNAVPSDWNDDWPTDMLIYLPSYHGSGFAIFMHSLNNGSKLYFNWSMPPNVPKLVRGFKQVRPYNNVTVPPLLLPLTRSGLTGPKGLSDCCTFLHSIASPLGKLAQKEIQETLQIKIGQFWGLTETTGPVTASNMIQPTIFGSSGELVAGMEMKFLDDQGNIAEHGEWGEIYVRGPLIMKEYFNNKMAYQKAVSKVRDIGYMDDEGRLFVVDRKADLLKIEDVLVSPSEVEDVLQSYPGIMDAAVVGLDGKEQIDLRAFVVLRSEKVKDNQINVYDVDVDHKALPDQGQIAKDIENFISAKLIKQKHLTGGVVFLTKIPKSTNSKILRKKLKELSV